MTIAAACAAPRHGGQGGQGEPHVTGCTAPQFGDHDYGQPPHNTPADPRDAPDETQCQTQSARPPFGPCQHARHYEIIMFQIATHDWIRVYACTPCAATIRERHRDLGPRRTNAVARIRNVRQP